MLSIVRGQSGWPSNKVPHVGTKFYSKRKVIKRILAYVGHPGILKSTYGALCKSRKVRKILKKLSDKRGLI